MPIATTELVTMDPWVPEAYRLTKALQEQYSGKARGYMAAAADSISVYVIIKIPRRKKIQRTWFKLPISQLLPFIEAAESMVKNKTDHRWPQSLQRLRLLGFDTCDQPDILIY